MQFYFLYFAETKKLFKIFNKYNIEARFVGGCVRDAICNTITDDFDIAVNCNIDKICNILIENNIKVIKTGINFFSIIVIINDIKYEITSLRQDINCSGRYCDTKDTSSFAIDSKRRDFTINALYVDQYGKLFDYNNGLHDLNNNIVRFIGNPKTRIEEDFLRIFRYYRFCTKYNDYSNRYSDTIKQESTNINKLSIERIQKELFKILEMSSNGIILNNMLQNNVLHNINIDNYNKLCAINSRANLSLKLYILFQYNYLINTLKLTKKLKNTIKIYKQFESEPLMYCAYKHSIEMQQDIILIKHIKYNEKLVNPIIYELTDNKFPIVYSDLPRDIIHVSRQLQKCERWWVINNFKPSKEECLKFIKDNIDTLNV